MFGLRLRSWMETHIVRPRKKQPPAPPPPHPQQQPPKTTANGRAHGPHGLDSAGNSPTSPLIVHRHPDAHHVAHRGVGGAGPGAGQRCPPPAAHPPPPPPGPPAGYGGTNLSSPESAYSTGYSTDGTSPGASFPPEYYINIRTGTHYFHSAPTPGAAPGTAPGAAPGRGSPRGRGRAARGPVPLPATPAHLGPDHHIYAQPRLLRPPAEDVHPGHRRTESCDEGRRCPPPPPPRASSTASSSAAAAAAPSPPPPASLLPSAPAPAPAAVAASPRQRNRIRTNPWVGGCKAGPGAGGAASQESSSSYGSGSDVTLPRPAVRVSPVPSAPVAAPDTRSPVSRAWGAARAAAAAAVAASRRGSLCSSTSSSGGSRTPHNASGASDADDDDLTLNEMLGRYDESYVYEKETDILSDSDPTDCDEEYGDEEAATGDSDPEAPGRAGGDEQDYDDLDFIDTGEAAAAAAMAAMGGAGADVPANATPPPNRGHCTYHPPLPPPAAPMERRPTVRVPRRAGSRRMQNPGSPGPQRALNGRASERRGSSNRHRRSAGVEVGAETGAWTGSRAPSEKKRLRCSVRGRRGAPAAPAPSPAPSPSPAVSPAPGQAPPGNAHMGPLGPPGPGHGRTVAEPLPLNRVLVQRMLARDAPCGTRSAGNTPVSLRRRLGDPPPASRLAGPPPDTSGSPVPTCSPEALKRRSNSLSGGTPPGLAARGVAPMPPGTSTTTAAATFASELALLEADQEAERKYRQLITDAEQILLGMRGALLVPPPPQQRLRPQPFFMNARYLVDECHRAAPPPSLPHPAAREGCECVSPPSRRSASPHAASPRCASPRVSPRASSPRALSPRAPSPRAPLVSRRRSSSSSSDGGSSTPRQSGSPSPPPGPPTARTSPSVVTSPTGPPQPAIIAFRSVDLGDEASSAYCPQSEPVKRKVYAGSATFGRLQKTLEKSQHQSLRLKAECGEEEDRGGAGNLQQKLLALRRERLRVEAAVREARDEERRRIDERTHAQRQLQLLRRQMLVHTIEGLKRSLEDQSARLHEVVIEPPEVDVPGELPHTPEPPTAGAVQ